MGNVPWDGPGINCYGMGMGQINMSHGQPWLYTNVASFAAKSRSHQNEQF